MSRHLLSSDAPVNQSVERAVRLLGFFSPEEPELTLAQLTQRLGTSRATTHRYTLALRRVGLLRFDPGAAVYSLGPRIVELAQGKIFLTFGAAPVELPVEERVQIEETRIAVNSQVVEGIRAIATPIFQGGELTAAMALVGTIASLPEGPRSDPAVRLRSAAEALSAELGSQSDERSTA